MAYIPRARSAPGKKTPAASGLPRANPTIAYLSGSPGGQFTYELWQMWRGVAEAAREWGFNLIYFAGDAFENSPQAVLYELIDARNVDGLIFWNSFFSQHSKVEAVQSYIQRFAPLPMVSIELALESCASLMIDNAQGVRDLLAHLIGGHGYRRIAFLNNPQSYVSRSREHAFHQVMSARGRFDPTLVGSLAELDARGLRPGVDYQALMAYSDDAAVQAMAALAARGVRVPDDVAITGFNDGMEARGASAPLTTMRLPFRSLGRRAVEMLGQQLRSANGAGDSPVPGAPAEVTLPLRLILRRSCGCLEPLAEQAAVRSLDREVPLQLGFDATLRARREAILDAMAQGMGTAVESQARHWAAELLDLFAAALRTRTQGSSPAPSAEYLRGLNTLLRDALEEGSNVSRWHEALSVLRRSLRPSLSGADLDIAEDLWQQARVLIGQAAVRAETHRSWLSSQRAEVLREIESNLLISADFQEMLNLLSAALPRLGVRDFYLVLYDGAFNPRGAGSLILACQNGQCLPVPAAAQTFYLKDILPAGWIESTAPYSLVIEALHLRDEQLGYVIFKTPPPPDASNCEIFQALRIQLSSAVKEVRLRQRLQDAVAQAEEANLLKSRFLSMVSHELRTPINLIVGLSEMAVRQQTQGRKTSLDVLKKFNEQIYASGQHLDRLIRDVLDLASSQAGQMKLVCNPVDLVPLLKDVSAIGQQLADQKNLDFRAEIPQRLPRVWGDKTRLRQIFLNLLSNAVKFTAHGEVALLVQTTASEVLIAVADTGLGIASEEQERIFDEFHQSDRTVVRGYGGAGLGLAITRRLVEKHSGRIWVSSTGQVGTGSTFHVALPVMAAGAAGAGAAGAGANGVGEDVDPCRRDGKVLVLTKAPGGAQSLVRRLSHHGYEVEELALEDHADLLAQLAAAPPGALVLDLAPASEQGWEIMRYLKENACTQDIPVLFYSLMEEENSGAVFEMDFLQKPVGAEQLVQALKRHGLSLGNLKQPESILIVDDEPGILDLNARIIQSQLPECLVRTAPNGREGLQVMRETAPDLVLLDLMMPEFDGFAVLKTMQEEPALRNIPVIVLSAQVLTREDMERLNQGVAAVLGKGLFSEKEILSRIEGTLARSKRLGSEAQRMVHHGMAYIHEHYGESISRADIANHLNVNEQYLSRAFNKELGIGPMTYLSRYRIQQARRLLEIGSLSITQVALEVGLSSQSYFSRIFQQEVGVTPSAYQHGVRPKP